MSDPRREKWEQRYLSAEPSANLKPASVLLNNQHFLPAAGTALDLACGLGDSALWLAQKGYSASAWDYANTAISRLQERASLLNIELSAHCKDARDIADVKSAFDIIVVRYFLDRTICSAISQALKPNGLLFYETFNEEKLRESSSKKPGMNPDFVLKHGELLHLFPNLKPIYYYEHGAENAMFTPSDNMAKNSSYFVFKNQQ